MIRENILVGIDFTRKLFRSRYMLRMMAMRELKSTYVGSVFGVAWAVISPLFQLLIYGIIFGVFFNARPAAGYGTDSYMLYLLCGLVPWQFFSQTVTATSRSVSGNMSLVKKAVAFPSEILPVVTVISNLLSHVISLVILMVIIHFMHGIQAASPLVFVYLFLLSLFAVGLGWILSGVTVFLRDIEQVLSLALMGWFFFTPILYAPEMAGRYQAVLMVNPLYHVVDGYRMALLAGQPVGWWQVAYLGGLAAASLAVGGVTFRKLKPWFAELL